MGLVNDVMSECEVKERSGLVRGHGLFLFPWIRSHRMRTKPRAHTAFVISCVILVNNKMNELVSKIFNNT